MTVTPWSEARLNALSVLWVAIYNGGVLNKDGEAISAEEAGFDAALAVLSKHGWAIVPAEATAEMVGGAIKGELHQWCGPTKGIALGINAAIKAGDVLQVKP